MIKYLKSKIFGMLAVALVLSACTSEFEEINVDPNKPTVVPATNVLSYALMDFTKWTYNTTIDGGESGYANQIGKIQYMEEAIYEFREGDFNTYFTVAYRDLLNLNTVIDMAQKDSSVNMEAVATTFTAFIYQTLTDMWRDIPFSEALDAVEGDYTPAYDTQETIYPAVMKMLADANDMFNKKSTDKLGGGDLLFKGNVALWQKFANSLRLRMAMRLSNVDPATAKSIVEEILGNPTKYPIMESNSDNAYFVWSGADPYQERWYRNSYIDGRDDHGVCSVLIDTLKSYADPRLPVYALPASTDGEYRGVVVGAVLSSFIMGDISRIGTRFRDDIKGFSPFMNYAEVMFLKAEAAQRGWSAGETAAEAYTAAVTASLQENGIDAAAIDAYLAQDKVAYHGDLTQIYLQKWISLFKNGPEAWAETRRTDVPLLGRAPDGYYTNHNRPPFRQPYPTDEYSLNEESIIGSWKKVTDRMWGQKMYWDTRTDVF